MNREDFEILSDNLIYFDNGATTFKPKCVIDSGVDYYSNYCDNERAGVARAVQKNKRPLKTFRQRIKVWIFLLRDKDVG